MQCLGQCLAHSQYINSSCSAYCSQRLCYLDQPRAGRQPPLTPGLRPAAGAGGVWVVTLYLADVKVRLGCGGCSGGLRE